LNFRVELRCVVGSDHIKQKLLNIQRVCQADIAGERGEELVCDIRADIGKLLRGHGFFGLVGYGDGRGVFLVDEIEVDVWLDEGGIVENDGVFLPGLKKEEITGLCIVLRTVDGDGGFAGFDIEDFVVIDDTRFNFLWGIHGVVVGKTDVWVDAVEKVVGVSVLRNDRHSNALQSKWDDEGVNCF